MPEFASKDYWDNRFSKDPSPFDWLVPAPALRDITTPYIQSSSTQENSQILHIGCGTSDSSHLRSLVLDPSQILNVDYSGKAVEAARQRETEYLREKTKQFVDATDADGLAQSALEKTMRWSCMNLLSSEPIIEILEQQVNNRQLFDFILDKSTSDSISSAHDVLTNVPYPLSINGWTSQIVQSGVPQKFLIHPLHVLAVNLAALTTPTSGRWIAISYSADRFPFLPPFPSNASHGLLDENVVNAGFPHPHQLWRLEKKEPIEYEETLAERKKRLLEGNVHRPQVSLWMYVLVRTEAIVTC